MTSGDIMNDMITSNTQVKSFSTSYSSASLLSSSKGVFLNDDNQSLLYSSPSCLYYDEPTSLYHYAIGFVKRLIHIYLSSPILLMILPLLLGILIGIFVQSVILNRRSGVPNDTSHDKNDKKSSKATSKSNDMVANMIQLMLSSPKHIFFSIVSCFVSIIPTKLVVINHDDDDVTQKEDKARCELQNDTMIRECNVNKEYLPKHIAVIMDGNRRYGKSKYGNITKVSKISVIFM